MVWISARSWIMVSMASAAVRCGGALRIRERVGLERSSAASLAGLRALALAHVERLTDDGVRLLAAEALPQARLDGVQPELHVVERVAELRALAGLHLTEEARRRLGVAGALTGCHGRARSEGVAHGAHAWDLVSGAPGSASGHPAPPAPDAASAERDVAFEHERAVLVAANHGHAGVAQDVALAEVGGVETHDLAVADHELRRVVHLDDDLPAPEVLLDHTPEPARTIAGLEVPGWDDAHVVEELELVLRVGSIYLSVPTSTLAVSFVTVGRGP